MEYWLQRKAKDLPTARVLLVEDKLWPGQMGAYWRPQSRETLDPKWVAGCSSPEFLNLAENNYTWLKDGTLVHIGQGVIVIDVARVLRAEAKIESTLAHEWRHHWQVYNRIWVAPIEANYKLPYRESMIDFFTRSRNENDALRFELKIAPNEVSRQRGDWLGMCVRSKSYLLPEARVDYEKILFTPNDHPTSTLNLMRFIERNMLDALKDHTLQGV